MLYMHPTHAASVGETAFGRSETEIPVRNRMEQPEIGGYSMEEKANSSNDIPQ